jgi:hypothetical protein
MSIKYYKGVHVMTEEKFYIKVCHQKIYGQVIEQLKFDGSTLRLFVASLDGHVYKLTRRKVYREEKLV